MIKRIFKTIREDVDKLISFVKSIFSDSDGTGSASRTAKLTVVGTSMLCLLLVVIWKRDLPSADQLSALAKVIGAASVAYVGNQLAPALQSMFQPKSNDPDPDAEVKS